MVSTAAAESLDEINMEDERLFAEPEGDEMVDTDNPTIQPEVVLATQ